MAKNLFCLSTVIVKGLRYEAQRIRKKEEKGKKNCVGHYV